MSLCCGECNEDVGPSNELPGREAVLLHPIVLSVMWSVRPDGQRFKLEQQLLHQHRCLCFRCIESAVPENQKTTLQRIYDAYEAETKKLKLDNELSGRWIEMNSPEGKIHSECNDRYFDCYKLVNTIDCLICGGNVNEKQPPLFQAFTIDRVRSGDNANSFGNYCLFAYFPGSIMFGFCGECTAKHFPKTFTLLGYSPQGAAPKEGGVELFISDEFMRALKNEVGEEEADHQIRKVTGRLH